MCFRVTPNSCLPFTQALERTGVSADDVSYVNAHGTSTPVGDMAEYRCLHLHVKNTLIRVSPPPPGNATERLQIWCCKACVLPSRLLLLVRHSSACNAIFGPCRTPR